MSGMDANRANEGSGRGAGAKAAAARPSNSPRWPLRWLRSKVVVLGGAALFAGLLLVGVIGLVRSGWSKAGPELTYYTVTRGPLSVDVLTRGTLEGLDNVDIICEVGSIPGSGYADSSGGLSGYGITRGSGSQGSVQVQRAEFRLPKLSVQIASSTQSSAGARGGGGSSSGVSSSGGSSAGTSSKGVSSTASSSGGGSPIGISSSGSRGRGGFSGGGYSGSGGSRSRGRGGMRGPQMAGGVQILYIVPNGAPVKKGDLLVQLDSTALEERLDYEVVAVERARADQIQATTAYENQITRNETSLANAELRVKLAELSLQELLDSGESGSFRMAMDKLDMQIKEALAAQALQQTRTQAISELYKLGYESRGNLSKEQLNLLMRQNALAIQLSGRQDLVHYQYEEYRLALQGALETARRRLEQTRRDNEAKLAEAKASKDAADRVLAKEEELLKKYQEQLAKCKIYAPRDGFVVYAVRKGIFSSFSQIYEGGFVRERQKILSLPGMERMQVKAMVHESVRNQIRVGMPATIRVDGAPGVVFHGKVATAAVMPDPGGIFDSDLKLFETTVTIDGKPEKVKPGMTAVVEIHAARLRDVLRVPVQAVVAIDGDNWCYVDSGRGVERRLVKLGSTNDEFVEIRDGLREGDRVVLDPLEIADDSRPRERAISPAR